MVELTQEEKTELTTILNNQYAAGPFSGMVFNAVAKEIELGAESFSEAYCRILIDRALKAALMTKLRLKEVSQ